MGRNGAGKSTLLRIIAGTLEATAGTVTTVGRGCGVLELGTGFHADYSGRENICLGGLYLRLSRREIDAGCRSNRVQRARRIHRPAVPPLFERHAGPSRSQCVATCVDPDILMIDEALSVRDPRFQLKSFDRIRNFRRRGETILVVSRSINQLVSVSDRALLLDRGRVVMDGEPNAVGSAYYEHGASPGTLGARRYGGAASRFVSASAGIGISVRGPRAVHAQIPSLGLGRCLHWDETLYFATSDNSPPTTNGRKYTLLVPAPAAAKRLERVDAISIQPEAKPLCAEPR